MIVKQKILGVSVTNAHKSEVLEFLLNRIKKDHTKTTIFTPNPEIIVYAKSHLDYQSKLNSADIALPDGVGVLLAARLMGKPLKERITGVDFMLELCKQSREKPLSIGLLGGGPGIAELTAKCLLDSYPWLTIVYVSQEWSQEGFKTRYNTEHRKDIDILFVAFGAPKQEEWIFENLSKLPVKAAMGVGGAFDYLSGSVKRAPKLIRAMGLEWLYRLVKQPWRWKRQIALITFLKLVLKERFSR